MKSEKDLILERKLRLWRCLELLMLCLRVVGSIALLAGTIYGPALLIGIFLLVFSWIFLEICARRLRRIVSEHVVPQVLQEVFDQVTYDPLGCTPCPDTLPLPRYRQQKGCHRIRGVYHGQSIEMSTLVLCRTRRPALSYCRWKRYRRIFCGVMLTFDTGRPIHAAVTLMERSLPNQKMGADSGIETENRDFNKRFCVRCADRQEALRILTPDVIGHIMSEDLLSRRHMYFEQSGKVHAAIACKEGLFEVTDSRVCLERLRRQFRGELQDILSVVWKSK